MKLLFFSALISGILFSASVQAQAVIQPASFESDVLNYQPVKRTTVTQKQFNYAVMILDETRTAVENNPANFNVADYLNVLSAFATLQEPPEQLELAFAKMCASDGACEYLLVFEDKFRNNPKYAPILDSYFRARAACDENGTPQPVFDLPAYCRQHQLDPKLVRIIREINLRDQQYRNGSGKYNSDQREPDLRNQSLVDSLYKVYGTYLGRTLVGEKFEHVMWAVIQHADVQMMERYLSVVHQAWLDNELDLTPFKMLLDRYYGLTQGYQIFGTQAGFGFELADEATRQAILEKWGL